MLAAVTLESYHTHQYITHNNKMSTPILFVIVGKNEPLFEAEIDTTGASAGNYLSTRQNYFVLHSSLDLVEKSSWTTNNMYLRVVDKVRSRMKVSCYFLIIILTQSNLFP